MPQVRKTREAAQGCGPMIPPLPEGQRPLRQQVFERVRAAGTVARVQLAKELGVSPASVTTATSELIDAGLIEEVTAPREDGQGRGRPAQALGVRSASHRVAGMKLSDREHTAVIVDFAGNLIADDVIPRRPGAMTVPEMLDAIEALFDRICAKAGLARSDISAIGIGVPGFVDSEAGMVEWSSTLTERRVPLAAAVQVRMQLPVAVDNDANLVALAELWFGAGRGRSDFAVVTIEHGVGMGLVLNHRIYRGARGLGLELGHTKVQLDGALCRRLADTLLARYPKALASRYGTPADAAGIDGTGVIEAVAAKRGFRIKGGTFDLEKAAITLLNDYRSGALGRISLETPASRATRPAPAGSNSAALQETEPD